MASLKSRLMFSKSDSMIKDVPLSRRNKTYGRSITKKWMRKMEKSDKQDEVSKSDEENKVFFDVEEDKLQKSVEEDGVSKNMMRRIKFLLVMKKIKLPKVINHEDDHDI
ncbi:hypothetical protein QL285_014456 [Trifolium repens]|nr:hypothetical protein QL285_014456 [Trifolium repens]